MIDPSIIRPDNAAETIYIQNTDVMSSSGPGRFAVGALFDAIQLFFSPTTSGLAPGTYTKTQFYTEFGLDTLQERALIFQQAALDDGNPDYALMAFDSYFRGVQPDIPALPDVYNRIGNISLPNDAEAVGFDASVYQVGGEIVISYRGTDFDSF